MLRADRESPAQMQAIDAKAVMAMVQQSGGGMSLAMEEKILNIENNVMDIKEVIFLPSLSRSPLLPISLPSLPWSPTLKIICRF